MYKGQPVLSKQNNESAVEDEGSGQWTHAQLPFFLKVESVILNQYTFFQNQYLLSDR